MLLAIFSLFTFLTCPTFDKKAGAGATVNRADPLNTAPFWEAAMSADQPTEVFAPIPGIPFYRVSDRGRVQSCNWSPKAKRESLWRDFKAHPNPKDGYLYIRPRVEGRYITAKVHRLVLMAFVGPCPDGMEACHFPDPDPTNNCLHNLRWDTHKANQHDKAAHGTRPMGERNGYARLADSDVVAIRSAALAGEGRGSLAARFGVSPNTISVVVSGRTWTHLPVSSAPWQRRSGRPAAN